jgi:uncharacterized phage-associated protein
MSISCQQTALEILELSNWEIAPVKLSPTLYLANSAFVAKNKELLITELFYAGKFAPEIPFLEDAIYEIGFGNFEKSSFKNVEPIEDDNIKTFLKEFWECYKLRPFFHLKGMIDFYSKAFHRAKKCSKNKRYITLEMLTKENKDYLNEFLKD